MDGWIDGWMDVNKSVYTCYVSTVNTMNRRDKVGSLGSAVANSTADSPVDLEKVVIESTIGSENTCVRAQCVYARSRARAKHVRACVRAHTAAIAMPAKR